jgi:hypothetical protein
VSTSARTARQLARHRLDAPELSRLPVARASEDRSERRAEELSGWHVLTSGFSATYVDDPLVYPSKGAAMKELLCDVHPGFRS